jgi:hypothetical protein
MTSHQPLSNLSEAKAALAYRSNNFMRGFDRRRRSRFGLLMGGQSP